ncbi:MAG: ABC transporter permease subunit [Thermomicrobiaceae bacterium]|nr:ABC transporter permease subunit [Thermomicrobiaceae bacterium]
MSVVMLRRALKDLRRGVLSYSLGAAVYGILILLFYPTVRRNAESFQELLKAYPKTLLEAFGVTTAFTSIGGFVSGEYLSFIWPLIASIFAVMAGSAVVAQEIDRGTAEFWLSVPESRARLLAAKLVALLIGIVALALATVVALAVGAALVGESFSTRGLLALAVLLVAFTVAVTGYAALFSSLSSTRGRPAALAAGLTLAFYLASIISGLSARFDWLRYLSIFTAYVPERALTEGTVPVLEVAALLALGLACALASLAIFQRRDVIL